VRRISNKTARKIALAAQGFADPRPSGRVTAAHIRRVLARIGMLQLDSVNVLVRSHYLPLFSRLGPYPAQLLDDYAYKRRHLYEYWGHAASLIPVERFPLLRFRMEESSHWGLQRFADESADYIDRVLDEVRQHGPIPVGELSDGNERIGSWWGWGKGKLALEHLFHRGLITASARTAFTRYYDLTERVIPPQHYNALPASKDDARRELLLLAAQHHGLGTAKDLADYYRLPILPARAALRDLASAHVLEQVEVQGWKEPAYLHPRARVPRRITANALLSMFDSLVWERDRTERLFDFRYRIEIYTPAPKRIYGYYVLPFLMGDSLVARVDLKADRQAKALLVRAAHAEPGYDKEAIAAALTPELHSMARWLDLADINISPTGDLAPFLQSKS
jgi:uncharacterized protein YcaQ